MDHPPTPPASEDALQVVFVTAPDLAQARALARALVGERLAACANLVPQIESIYHWDGAICEDPEVLLILKTRAALLPALAARVKALHPYQVPEVIGLPTEGGLPAYLDWVRQQTRPGAEAVPVGGQE